MNIKKRNGSIEEFDECKIINAVTKAFKDNNNETPTDWIATIPSKLNIFDGITVEEIQNQVVTILHEANYDAVTSAYSKYREQHRKERNAKKFTKILKKINDGGCDVNILSDIAKKLFATDVVNQNANVDEESFGGRYGEAADVLLKNMALNYCMSEKSKNHHINNEIYIHDLSHYALGDHNCITIPFDNLLKHGFITRQTDIRPANSVSTAFQLVAVIFQAQSLDQFGGVSASHIDHTMVPYVRKSFYKHYIEYIDRYPGKYYEPSIDPTERSIYDDCYIYPEASKYALEMTEKELKQAVEAMYHNLKRFG